MNTSEWNGLYIQRSIFHKQDSNEKNKSHAGSAASIEQDLRSLFHEKNTEKIMKL